jgi:hypothetical protein
VTIVSLPAQGSLTLAGAPVAAGAVVAEAQIAAGDLVFTAAPDQYGAGYASFGFRVSDGLANAAAANTLSIDVAGTSDLPTVAARTLAGSEDVVVAFAAADFASAFTDVDGDTLVQVQIVSLPANGTLTLGGTPVAVNDVVSAAQLSSLQFAPSANWSGSTLFAWHGHDGTGYSVLAADMTLTLAAVNDVPVLAAGAAGGSDPGANADPVRRRLACRRRRQHAVPGRVHRYRYPSAEPCTAAHRTAVNGTFTRPISTRAR